ncbi:MAG TPA: dihydropteroate synthase, partial [Herpetosiphonaceae bacterium]|nr:dihydropteroate synthase [Herpetosiphonaceae bacterium]
MANRFNVRPLFVPGPADLAREVARIESFPERVAAATSKGSFVVLHVSGLEATAAMVLKQELLALDADCVISPEVYLGDRSARTDGVLMGTSCQYARLVPRLRHFPIGDLPGLAEEIERTLASVAGTPDPIEVAGTSLIWGERTYVMGILNITPDSFSGDGLAAGGSARGQSLVAAALSQARAFLDAGADLLDVGGESTRPGGMPVSVEEERERVVPVVEALRADLGVPISVDTYKAEVAAAALDAGASLVNDVWGLRGREGGWNEALARVVAEREVPLVLM